MTSASLGTVSRTGVNARNWQPALARAALLLAIAAAAVAGVLATGHASAAAAISRDGPELTRLLRSMAVLKLLMAAAATAGVLWRFGSRARLPWLAAYAAATLAMWTGPGLIWQMAHLRLGALLLHGGLFTSLILLWRDPVVGERLAAIIARRRQALRAIQPD